MQESSNKKQLIADLSLVLLYLTSWTENKGTDFECLRSWRSYDWDALDSLQETDLISFSRKNKSAYLTNKGIESAKEIIERLSKDL
jgi:hypothetical protein